MLHSAVQKVFVVLKISNILYNIRLSDYDGCDKLENYLYRIRIISRMRISVVNPLDIYYKVHGIPENICITFIQCRPNVFDVGPTLYKCYTNVLCLLGCLSPRQYHRAIGTLWMIPHICEIIPCRCRDASIPSTHETLTQCWFNVGPTS